MAPGHGVRIDKFVDQEPGRFHGGFESDAAQPRPLELLIANEGEPGESPFQKVLGGEGTDRLLIALNRRQARIRKLVIQVDRGNAGVQDQVAKLGGTTL